MTGLKSGSSEAASAPRLPQERRSRRDPQRSISRRQRRPYKDNKHPTAKAQPFPVGACLQAIFTPTPPVGASLAARSEPQRGQTPSAPTVNPHTNVMSLIPHHQEVSTQEAANLLNVSRPFLVGLLEKGEIPFRKVGSHRRVLLTDVLTYKETDARKRKQAQDELAKLSQEEDMGY
ncbi:MAG: hypothetical protein CL537_04865 [Alcanivoracaceae bacterium]|nr:hypothetical protein [Alcanivoracaceae bacterium]|tara:strand:+ start:79 stop:606 length:528 start_codon:yes stop_codon:yes gene_type:complete